MPSGEHRTSPRAWRPTRKPIQGVRAQFGNLECSLANLSATGAMIRSRHELAVGSEALLSLELEPSPLSVRARIVRCEPVDVALPGEVVWRRQEFAMGVMFLDRSEALTETIQGLTR